MDSISRPPTSRSPSPSSSAWSSVTRSPLPSSSAWSSVIRSPSLSSSAWSSTTESLYNVESFVIPNLQKLDALNVPFPIFGFVMEKVQIEDVDRRAADDEDMEQVTGLDAEPGHGVFRHPRPDFRRHDWRKACTTP